MSRWLWAPTSLYTAMILPSLLFPASAHALSSTRTADIIVSVGWSGNACVALNEPDPRTNRSTITQTVTCNPSGGAAIRYTGRTGEWVGVDPVEDGVTAVACEVDIDGVTVMKSVGLVNVSCLGRL